MDDWQAPQFRERLREAYDQTAHERETYPMQDWKIQERAAFLAALQRENKQTLLELGAGTGRDSLFFKENGMQPLCLDLSPVMVELCRQKGLEAQVMDMTQLEFPEASFDAAYAMNSLLHLSKAEFPDVLRRVDRLLKPGGLFFLGVYGGIDHEGIWEKDGYRPQRFFSFFEDSQIEQAVSRVFAIERFKRIVLDPQDPIHFQSMILRRRGSL